MPSLRVETRCARTTCAQAHPGGGAVGGVGGTDTALESCEGEHIALMDCFITKKWYQSCSEQQQAFWNCYRRERVRPRRAAAWETDKAVPRTHWLSVRAPRLAEGPWGGAQGVAKTKIKDMLERKL